MDLNRSKTFIKAYLTISIAVLLQFCTTQKSVTKRQDSTTKSQKIDTLSAKVPADTISVDKASPFHGGFARVVKDSSSFYISKKGRRIFKHIVKSFHPLDSVTTARAGYLNLHKNKEKLMRIVTTQDHKFGMANEQGQWVFKPKYDSLSFKFKRYIEIRKDGKMTYADSWGKLLVPLKFEDVGIMDGEHYDVKRDGKWGIYQTSTDKIVIPFKYDGFDYCGGCGGTPNYLYAQKDGKWGVIDLNNKVLVPFNYEHQHLNMRSDEWVTAFHKNKKPIVINISLNKTYGAPEYTSPEIINGLLVAMENEKYGMINSRGKQVLDFNYDDIWDPYRSFQSGPYLIVQKEKKYGVIDTLGHTIIPMNYSKEVYPRGDYFVFEEKGKSGLLNAKNKVILAAKYKRLHAEKLTMPDGSEIAVFELYDGKKQGFFIPKTSALVPPKFDKIKPCTFNKWRDEYDVNFPPADILVKKSDKFGFYSAKGKEIIPPNYYHFQFVTDTEVILQKNQHNNEGLYDLQQKKTLIPYKYLIDPIPSDSTLLKVQRRVDGTLTNYTVFDLNGKKVLSMDYQKIKALGGNDFLLQQKDSPFLIWNSKTHEKERLPFAMVTRNDTKFPFGTLTKKDRTPLLKVQKKSKTFLYDYKQKKKLLKKGYKDIEQLKNGYFVVTQKDSTGTYKYGYANAKGKLIVPIKYDTKPNEYVTEFQNKDYLPLYKFNPKKSRFITNNYKGYADFKGKVLVPPTHKKVFPELNGHGFLTENSNHFGVIDANGKEILPAKYNIILNRALSPYKDTAEFNFPLLFSKEGRWQYINKDGKILPVQAHGYIHFRKRRPY